MHSVDSGSLTDWSGYWHTFADGKTPSSMDLIQEYIDNINPGEKVLDIGCGYGRLTRQLPDLGVTAVGIDINQNELAVANSQQIPGNEVKYIHMSASAMTFPDNHFDHGILLGVLGGVHRVLRQQIVHEGVRVLKPGGYLYTGEFTRKKGLKRFVRYVKDALHTRELGSNIVRDRKGEILFIAYHFYPQQLRRLFEQNGLQDVQVREQIKYKLNFRDNNLESRKTLSVWGRKAS